MKTRSDSCIAVILAGGLSLRMGRDKASLVLAGETLLARTARLCNEAGCSTVWLSVADEGGAQKWVNGLTYEIIPDAYWQMGPMAAVLSAIRHYQAVPKPAYPAPFIAFFPVDLPCLTVDGVRAFIQWAKNTTDKGKMAFHWAHHPLPLILRINATVITRVNAMGDDMEKAQKGLVGQSLSVKSFLAELPVAVGMGGLLEKELVNTNTPEDWKEVFGEYPAW